MARCIGIAGIGFAMVICTLFTTVSAHASLLDCTKAVGLDLNLAMDCMVEAGNPVETDSLVEPTAMANPPAKVASTTFPVIAEPIADALPGYFSLILFFGALFSMLLLRIKPSNPK